MRDVVKLVTALLLGFVLSGSSAFSLAPKSPFERPPTPIDKTLIDVSELIAEIEEVKQQKGESFEFLIVAENVLTKKGYQVAPQEHPLVEVIQTRDITRHYLGEVFSYTVFVHPDAFTIVFYSFPKKGFYRVLPDLFFPLEGWGQIDFDEKNPFYFQIFSPVDKAPFEGSKMTQAVMSKLYGSIGFKPEKIPNNIFLHTPPKFSTLENRRAVLNRAKNGLQSLQAFISRFRGSKYGGGDSFLTHVALEGGVPGIPFSLVHEMGHGLFFTEVLSDQDREEFYQLVTTNPEVISYLKNVYTDIDPNKQIPTLETTEQWLGLSEYFARALGLFMDQTLQHTRKELTFSKPDRPIEETFMPNSLIRFYVKLGLFQPELIPREYLSPDFYTGRGIEDSL